MYCNNCGKFLLENDKFCSNCGARVFQSEKKPETDLPTEGFKTEIPEDQTPKPTPPTDKIRWNIEDFPGHDVKKTEEINFDWGNNSDFKNSDFKKTEATEKEIALDPVQKPESVKPTEGGFIAAEVVEEQIIQGKDLEEEIFAEASLVESIPAGGDIHKRTKIVDKFYTFSKKNEEFQKLLDKEYEKIKAGESDSMDEQTFRDRVSEINQKSDELWPEFNPTEHLAEMAMARERFFGPMEDPYKDIKAEEPPVAEEPPIAEEPAEFEAVYGTEDAPAVESVALEEQAEEETVAEPTPEPIDIPGEEPLPEDNLLPDLEICNAEQTIPARDEEPEPKHEPEPVPPFSTPLDDNLIPEDFEEPKPEEANLEEPKDEAFKSEEAITMEPKSEEAKAEQPKHEDEVLSIRDRWIQYEEDEEDEEEAHSRGIFGKIVIAILVILLLSELALMGVRYLAPDSALGKFIEEKMIVITEFFQGNANSVALTPNRSVAAEDKTGLIQQQILLGKNYNDNIAVIKYNGDLRLNTAKKYSDASLNRSTILEDNEWYAKEDGSLVYYDDQAVGIIIAHESARRLAEGEKFATLEIGEIRISGEDLYIWVAETITPGDRQEKIFRITVSGETMNVNTEYDV